jgi:hypothetical protein
VFFDAASGVNTVTIASGNAGAQTITCTGFTGTFAGSASITVSGNITLASGMTVVYTGTLTLNATATVLTFGKTLGPLTISGSAITVTLGDAFASSGVITVTQGIFTTANYSVTADSISSSNTNTRTINLGSSTVTLTGSSPVTFTSSLTLNAGTSNLLLTYASTNTVIFTGGGKSFFNVSFTSTSATGGKRIFNGNSFNNLILANASTTGLYFVGVDANQTISGLFEITSGTDATCRSFLYSTTTGTTVTLSCDNFSCVDVDFRDIAITGFAAPASGFRLGDCGGNSGITFSAPKTVYKVSGANWSSVDAWATSSGGVGATNNFPLAQDTCIFDNVYPGSGGGQTISIAWNIGTINMSARTSTTMQLILNGSPSIYGNWINGTGSSIFANFTRINFLGRGSQQITSAGQVFGTPFTFQCIGGSVTLQDALTSNVGSTSFLQAGTLNLNGYTFTLSGRLDVGSSTARSLAFGSGSLVISVNLNAFDASSSSNFTVTGSGTISLTSSSAKTFNGGGVQTYPTINQGGIGTLTVTGSNRFLDITNTAIGRIQFTGGTTNQFNNFGINGVSGNLLQLGSTNTTQAILSKATTWNVGANSVNGGNNTGINFVAGSNDYLSVSYINGIISAIDVFISESSSGSDLVSANTVVAGAVSEAASATDFASAVLLLLASIVDAASAASNLNAQIDFAALLAEAAQSASTTSARAVFGSDVAEAAEATEAAAALLVLAAAITEAATAEDLISAVLAFNCAIAEAVRGQDAATTSAVLNVVMPELARASESLIAGNVYNVTLPESVGASDIVAGAFLWNLVDDSQAVNWSNVVNPQNPGWSGINDSQGPNWQNINN